MGEAVTKKTIVFKEPTQLPSSERSIVWVFPFDVVDTDLLGQPEQWSHTSLHSITITVTIELASSWRLFHPLPSTNDEREIQKIYSDHQDLMKILFWYGKRNIENKLKAGTLQPKEQLLLSTDSPEISDRLDPSRVPEPNGFTFEV